MIIQTVKDLKRYLSSAGFRDEQRIINGGDIKFIFHADRHIVAKEITIVVGDYPIEGSSNRVERQKKINLNRQQIIVDTQKNKVKYNGALKFSEADIWQMFNDLDSTEK